MDHLTRTQLLMIEAGGNLQFAKFLNIYGLKDQPNSNKYFTKAAQYYRQKLKELIENGHFKEEIDWEQLADKPSTEEGLEEVLMSKKPSMIEVYRPDMEDPTSSSSVGGAGGYRTLQKKQTITISLNDE